MPTKEISIFCIKLMSIRWGVADETASKKPVDPILEQDRLILSGKLPYYLEGKNQIVQIGLPKMPEKFTSLPNIGINLLYYP